MLATHRQSVFDSPAHRMPAFMAGKSIAVNTEERVYRLVAVSLPAGHGESERAVLALHRYAPLVEYLAQRMSDHEHPIRTTDELEGDAVRLAQRHGLSLDQVRRMLPRDARQSNSLLRPFVLRAVRGERIQVHVTNRTHLPLQVALLDDDFGIQQTTEPRMLAPDEIGLYSWQCKETGIFPIFNQACASSMPHRCLLGVLMIEP
ncbi:MAG: hypothetical protein KJZ95_10740 [Caldilinea sp.]|nr:hypothetical protein [Caldilinea sp.]